LIVTDGRNEQAVRNTEQKLEITGVTNMTTSKNDVLREEILTDISEDRRTKQRYPVDFALTYRVMKNGLVKLTGSGTVLNMSSSGIAFSTEEPLLRGAMVELSIAWPVLLNGNCPMKMVAEGRVVRSTGTCTAIRMDRHEFRTQARSMQQPAKLPMAVGYR
jgi:hypothetical protein